MRRRLDEEDASTSESECTDDERLSEDARRLLGRLFSAWRWRGEKTSDFQGLLKEAGYLIPVRNLSRWRGMAEDPRPPTIPRLSV